MAVDTFETPRPKASPKVPTILRFATRTPPIPVTVDIFVTQKSKSGDGSAFGDNFSTLKRARHSRTPANDCGHKRNDFWSPPRPLDPNLKTGTLLAFGKLKLALAMGIYRNI